jgi:hypothetical protein
MVPLMFRDASQIQCCQGPILNLLNSHFFAVAQYMAQGVKQEFGLSKLSFDNMIGCQQAISV